MLNHAVAKRRPPPGLIFHTDRGIEYYANAFCKRLSKLKITQSINRPGKVTHNAFMESFLHSMKADVIHGNTDGQLLTVFRSYFPFYNHSRMHSSLNYECPTSYENQLASSSVNFIGGRFRPLGPLLKSTLSVTEKVTNGPTRTLIEQHSQKRKP